MLPQYIKKETNIHKLPLRVKFSFLLANFIVLMLYENPLILVAIFFCVILVVVKSKTLKEWTSLLKFVIIMIFFVIIFNLLILHKGETVLLSGPNILFFGRMNITLETLFYSLSMSLSLLVIIRLFSIVTFTTHPDYLLESLSLILPKSMLALSLSLNLYPAFVRKAKDFTRSLELRGLDFDEGNITHRLKKKGKIITPLISSTLESVFESAESLEARGFGLKRRKLEMSRLNFSQRFSILLSFLLVVIAIFGIVFKVWNFEFFPIISGVFPESFYGWVWFFLLFLFNLPILLVKASIHRL